MTILYLSKRLVSLTLNAHVSTRTKAHFMYQNDYPFILFEIRRKIEQNELNELECSKIPTQISSYAHKHVFLYLHAQKKTFIHSFIDPT